MPESTQVELVPISSIIISPTRQRKYFDIGGLIELAQSIKENELIHPLALEEHTNQLVAGERRLRALSDLFEVGVEVIFNTVPLPPFHVPVTRMSHREAVDYYEAELAENTHRHNLTWQEEEYAKARLHAYRLEQTGGKQTFTDTAKEIFPNMEPEARGSYVQAISDAVVVADHLDDPEVASAASKGEALKIIKKKAQEKYFAEQASTILSSGKKESPHTLIKGDATSEIQHLPDSSIDILLTDPPYGVGANRFGDQTFASHEYDDSHESWIPLMSALAINSFTVTKPQAHAFVFCDIRRWEELSSFFSSAGWDVWSRPLIWYKGNIGTLPRPNHGPRFTYETILYAIKGNREQIHVGHDVISIPAVLKPGHAAEKPVELYTELLSRIAHPGDTILDPFCGGGTIFPAADLALCKAVGIEKEEKYYNMALTRMNKGE